MEIVTFGAVVGTLFGVMQLISNGAKQAQRRDEILMQTQAQLAEINRKLAQLIIHGANKQ